LNLKNVKKRKDRDHLIQELWLSEQLPFLYYDRFINISCILCGDVHVYAKYDHQPFTTEIVKRTQII